MHYLLADDRWFDRLGVKRVVALGALWDLDIVGWGDTVDEDDLDDQSDFLMETRAGVFESKREAADVCRSVLEYFLELDTALDREGESVVNSLELSGEHVGVFVKAWESSIWARGEAGLAASVGIRECPDIAFISSQCLIADFDLIRDVEAGVYQIRMGWVSRGWAEEGMGKVGEPASIVQDALAFYKACELAHAKEWGLMWR